MGFCPARDTSGCVFKGAKYKIFLFSSINELNHILNRKMWSPFIQAYNLPSKEAFIFVKAFFSNGLFSTKRR